MTNDQRPTTMVSATLVIAVNVFRESVRDKVLYNLVLFAILFIAVFIGIGLVSKEVERRSIYSLLAKPIHRYQIVIGKYAGLTLTLAVNVAVMAAALYLVLAYMGWGIAPEVARGWDAPTLDP